MGSACFTLTCGTGGLKETHLLGERTQVESRMDGSRYPAPHWREAEGDEC